MESFKLQISKIMEEKRFDVKFYEKAKELEKYPQEMLFPLENVLDFLKEKRDPTKTPDEMFFYIDIQSIDVNDGSILRNELPGEEAPSRARMVVHEGDIIISTCRPTRKAIAIIPPELDNQIASTGFSITRPKPEYNANYILHILRSNAVAKQLDRFSSGTSYPAVLEKHIRRVKIPINPSKKVQISIANFMNKAYAERRNKIIEGNTLVDDAKTKMEDMLLS